MSYISILYTKIGASLSQRSAFTPFFWLYPIFSAFFELFFFSFTCVYRAFIYFSELLVPLLDFVRVWKSEISSLVLCIEYLVQCWEHGLCKYSPQVGRCKLVWSSLVTNCVLLAILFLQVSDFYSERMCISMACLSACCYEG